MRSAFLQMLHEDGGRERNERNKMQFFVSNFPLLPQNLTQWMIIAADCCLQKDTVTVMFSILLYSTYVLQIFTNCKVCNWTVLTVIKHKLLLHVQLYNSTAHLLYKYCTNCTVCNWTVPTVITQMLLLNIQLHNSTAHLLYKYCTNCTVCNWTVLTVITHKLLLHVQLHNSTAHLLYKPHNL
jgi:hypothetical protein